MTIQYLLTHNVEEVIVKKHLEQRLKRGEKLRIKLGADPTAPDLHLGHAVVLWKLKEFQDLGHKIIFIIGDFTAKIGDPSGRLKTRPPLSDLEIKKNATTYFKQVGKILNANKLEIVYNSRWFSKMNLADLLKLTAQFSLWRILERDDFEKRRKEKRELLCHEILYPMMQAYDSIQVKADIEIGGTDQKFNMLAGRVLQRKLGLPEQDIIICPLLLGTDGKRKMSKSYGNYIGLLDRPEEMFGKVMSIPDDLVISYFKLATRLADDEIKKIEKDFQKRANRRDLKARLAREIVTLYYNKKKAQEAQKEFEEVFRERKRPKMIPEVKISKKRLKLLDLLIQINPTLSKSQARRLVEQGGVKIENKTIKKWDRQIFIRTGLIVQMGKRKFVRVK